MTRNTPVLMTVMAASLTSICKSPQKSQNNTLDPDYPAQFHIPAAESNFITEEKEVSLRTCSFGVLDFCLHAHRMNCFSLACHIVSWYV